MLVILFFTLTNVTMMCTQNKKTPGRLIFILMRLCQAQRNI